MAKEFMDSATSDIIAQYGLRQFENKLIVNPLSKEDATKLITLYLNFVAKQSNQSIVRLKNAIIASINNPISRNLQLYNTEQSDYVNNVLEPFLNNSYRVLDSIQELDELGIILLQNVNSGGIVAISVSANNFNAKDKDGNTYAQLEFFKIFTLLNNLYNELNLNVNPIQQVVILDLDNKTSKQGNINVEFDNYIKLAITKSHDVKIKASSLPTFEETAQQNLHGYLKAYNQNDKAEIAAIFNGITGNA
jgi:hypothetical protein